MLLYDAIVFLPLMGFLIAGLFGRALGPRPCEIITTGAVCIAAFLSVIVFVQIGFGDAAPVKHTILSWIHSGSFEVDWAIRVDTLTAVMLVVVNGVSALVHLYSIGYMHEDPDRPRFFAYLSLFTFAMLALVTADNFVQMFFGWEGVGVASYLLIGFWFKKPSANAAAIKAFVVNRVGDFGFILGIAAIFILFDSVDFDTVFAAAPEKADLVITFLGIEAHALTVACLLLFMGAMGKSAQLFLHTWLPDAMEGPTPVSALIHAATMVTAGVFLVCRCAPLFELAPGALEVVTVVGATTAFFAATVGLFQNDIKRVIAYSTCSQLGYMFFAAGVSAYPVAMFHLFTHAFFKALLFLGAGAVIHGMHHEQDMRNMGGLRKKLPVTWAMMLIGTLALTGVGIPGTGLGFAGFFSKDAAIEAAFAAGDGVARYAFWMAVIAAVLTSFYSWRLIFMTFHGKTRADEHTYSHAHDAPPVMQVPLFTLAIGAVLAGLVFVGAFIGKDAPAFWGNALPVATGEKLGEEPGAADPSAPAPSAAAREGEVALGGLGPAETAEGGAAHGEDAHATDSHGADAHGAAGHGEGRGTAYILEAMHHVPLWVKWAPLVVSLLGFLVAAYYYLANPQLPARMAERKGPLYSFLYNKWYFDELYEVIFVRPAFFLGRLLWKGGDGRVIDGVGPDGVAARVLDVTRAVVRLQSGYLYHYAFAMLIGVAALVTWFMVRGG
ncbi:MAG: NADH-quinone oxidoreductase subunit L [Alphaproteobacteria bacterium]|nr:NADH-quinone oxidoreductase subunit L [Alphaproteobacteria bacterium]